MGEVVDADVDFRVDLFQIGEVLGEEGGEVGETREVVEGVAEVEEVEEVCCGVGASGRCHDIDF